MSFASDRQLAAVCQALVEPLGKGTLWRDGEMTSLGAQWLKRMPGFSHGEAVLIRFAFVLWNDSNKGPKVAELLHVLDGNHLRRIATLMLAMAAGRPEAIERWLDQQTAALGQEPEPDSLPPPQNGGGMAGAGGEFAVPDDARGVLWRKSAEGTLHVFLTPVLGDSKSACGLVRFGDTVEAALESGEPVRPCCGHCTRYVGRLATEGAHGA